jgi:hypothetical protein
MRKVMYRCDARDDPACACDACEIPELKTHAATQCSCRQRCGCDAAATVAVCKQPVVIVVSVAAICLQAVYRMLHDIAAVDLDTMPPKYMAACVEAGLSPDAGACCTGEHLLQF